MEDEEADERGTEAAGDQVVGRPPQVAREVPADEADGAVEVDRDVAGADALGQVVGGAPPQSAMVISSACPSQTYVTASWAS